MHFRLAALAACMASIGCGAPPSPATLKLSYKAVQEADAAYGSKDFTKAVTLYKAVIDAGAVHADVLGDVFIKLALCQIETGELPAAEESLSKAEQAGAVGSAHLAAQGALAMKKGDAKLARELYGKARAGDPTVVVPKELEAPDKKKPS